METAKLNGLKNEKKNCIPKSGFINLLKPPGMTSHDVVSFVRRVLHEKHVGHTGTLDPGAAGVLPIAVGKATRLIEYLSAAGKSYRAEIQLGFATDSGDDSGKVVEAKTDFVMPDAEAVKAVLKKFTGEITQVPPAHSAIKINGRRACDLIRQGVQVEIPSRQVTIYRIELLALDNVRRSLLIDVDCSKGTYIRSLCADIGAAMDIPATMSFLVRTAVGDFKLKDAYSLEELSEAKDAALLKADGYISFIPIYEIEPKRVRSFCNGLSTTDRKYALQTAVPLRVYGRNRFLGIGHFDGDSRSIVPDKVIADAKDY